MVVHPLWWWMMDDLLLVITHNNICWSPKGTRGHGENSLCLIVRHCSSASISATGVRLSVGQWPYTVCFVLMMTCTVSLARSLPSSVCGGRDTKEFIMINLYHPLDDVLFMTQR